MRATDKGEMKR